MNILHWSGVTVGAALLLSSNGCGRLQGQPSTLEAASKTDSSGHAAFLRRGDNVERPKTNKDLIYASGPSATYILTYPDGMAKGSIQIEGPSNICANEFGQVFIPARETIVEYEHGGTTPIGFLDDKGFVPLACAADPTNEALAVTNIYSAKNGLGNVAIYQRGDKKPTFRVDPSITNYYFCAYDSRGNLYVDGTEGYSSPTKFILAELPKGSPSFRNITGNLPTFLGQLQWDGKYLVYQAGSVLYQISVSGTVATIAGKTTLRNAYDHSSTSYIEGHGVLAPAGQWGSRLGFWKYPSGGKRYDATPELYAKHTPVSAITISKSN